MDQLYKQILRFQSKSNDYIDDHSLAVSRSLKAAIQRLEDDVQVKKNSQSIISQAQKVTALLESAGEHNAMSHGHVRELLGQVEGFIEHLRKLK